MDRVGCRALALLFLLIAGFPGCGGGTSSTADTSGSSGFSSGSDRNKSLASFSSNEVDQICQSYDRFFGEALTPELLCQFVAVLYVISEEPVPTEQLCLNTTSECLRALGSEVDEVMNEITPECPRQGFSQPNCDVTVGEWEQCVVELRSNFVKLNEIVSCSTVESFSYGEILTKLQNPPPSPKCQEIKRRCPGTFHEADTF